MRYLILLASTSLLAACGGGGGSVASAPNPATGGGSGGASGTPHTFVEPILQKNYVGLGATQVLEYETRVDQEHAGDPEWGSQDKVIYSANSTTPRNSSISVDYDPTSATFTVRVPDSLSAASADTRFQDPASRTDFGGLDASYRTFNSIFRSGS